MMMRKKKEKEDVQGRTSRWHAVASLQLSPLQHGKRTKNGLRDSFRLVGRSVDLIGYRTCLGASAPSVSVIGLLVQVEISQKSGRD
ncbi:unnamed protein product [Caenorhabditis auriculariae]|uniref:Uncharacterized protein n=1 Tax=Caenorhabditis auriculariae TaxID=2777116 RepID=A0A8S1HMG4_9PELO|nr:unnamed protein product [Caenorhabditis auriculariae]